MKSLISLIYLSDSNEKVDEQEVEKILKQSRQNNLDSDITGVLLLLNSQFLQVLEGDKTEVHKLYEKIKGDKRHFKILKLIEFDLIERNFGDWSMGYLNPNMDRFFIEGYKDPAIFIEVMSNKDTWTPAFEFLKKFYKKNK